mmetsp:Transcript_13561/g.12040  ORF Transcript_13561/g.12040 Transcript_13561/m.12040 type:complete len:86 (+) Transcript_13561:275-532(+)
MEAQIKDLENITKNDRKHMSRLQNLNSQLLTKIKSMDHSEKLIGGEEQSMNLAIKELSKENVYLKEKNKEIMGNYKDLKGSFQGV